MLLAFWAAAVAPAPAPAQDTAGTSPATSPAGEELILTLRANGVERGEFTLLRRPDGDFWLLTPDLPRLQLQPQPGARRPAGGQDWSSLRALGARNLRFLEADLALELEFAVDQLAGTRIDLSGRVAPTPLQLPAASLILSYRLGLRDASGQRQQVALDSDWNLRLGQLLLRQETRLATGAPGKDFQRGRTQLVWDDPGAARRVEAGDVFSTAGSFGGAITGAGVVVRKLYDLAPHLIRQPTASLQATTALPAEVEVAVDGATIHRERVPPGPIAVDNLLLYGGSRTVRVTVTDASGRREVYEQPFMFTDTVLAEGLHEYSYFAGRRSELDGEGVWRYREAALQGYHRYGVSDHVTVAAGGEGNADFASGGAGIALRSDRLGLLSLELLASRGRDGPAATGWSARYTYLTQHGALVLGRRQFGKGFRTFTTSADNPFLQHETRVGWSTRVQRATLAADLVRSVDPLQDRLAGALRVSTSLPGGGSLSAELLGSRTNGRRDWAAYVYYRQDLDARSWVGTTVRTGAGARTVELDAGRRVQGEGLEYRVGVTASSFGEQDSGYGTLSANWHLRPATLEFYGSSPLRGTGHFAEVGVSGALVAIDGSWGATRRVDDSFVLARLGVPQEGVEVLLNNQPQGRTNARGELFLPEVGAFGRQDVSVDDRQLDMRYLLQSRRQTITPAYRSGVVVEFGGRRQRAVAGYAWRLRAGDRTPVAARAWSLSGPGGTLQVETGTAGDFYLEDVSPGRYTGSLTDAGETYACTVTIPDFAEVVHELADGIVCK